MLHLIMAKRPRGYANRKQGLVTQLNCTTQSSMHVTDMLSKRFRESPEVYLTAFVLCAQGGESHTRGPPHSDWQHVLLIWSRLWATGSSAPPNPSRDLLPLGFPPRTWASCRFVARPLVKTLFRRSAIGDPPQKPSSQKNFAGIKISVDRLALRSNSNSNCHGDIHSKHETNISS